MPAGFQVFGPDGALWVDTSSWLGRLIGTVTVGPGSGSVNLPALSGQGRPFGVMPNWPENSVNTLGATWRAPVVGRFDFSGTTLNVNFLFANYSNPYATVFYGAY